MLSKRAHLSLHSDSALPSDEDGQGFAFEADIERTGVRRPRKVQQVRTKKLACSLCSPWRTVRQSDAIPSLTLLRVIYLFPHRPPLVSTLRMLLAGASSTVASAISAILQSRVPSPGDVLLVRPLSDVNRHILDTSARFILLTHFVKCPASQSIQQ